MKRRFIFIMLISLLLMCNFTSFSQEITEKRDRAWFGLAQSLNNLSRYDESEKILKELYSRYPENKYVAIELAKALGYKKQFKQSSDLLENLEKRYPQDEYIKYIYATVLESNDRLDDAKNRYLELLKVNPDDEKLQLKVAEVSSWAGDYDTSIYYYKIVLDKHKDDVSIKLKLADVLFWSRNYEEAVGLYEEAGVRPEEDRQRYKNLGGAYFGAGRFDDAIEVYNRFLEIYPDDIEARADLANAFYASGRIDEAEKQFKIIMKAKPEDTEAMLKLAEILATRQRYQEAIEICREILARDPENRIVYLWLARFLGWSTEYSESIDAYNEIIEENPEWITPRREKARVLGWMRKYKKSIDEYQKIIDDIGPDEASILEMQSKKEFYKLFDSNAIKNYKKWLKIEPYDLEALYDIAQVYSRQMQWKNAREAYSRVLNILPSHFRAKHAINKVDLYSRSVLLNTGFEFYEADSTSRDMDKKYYDIYFGYKAPLWENMCFKAAEETLFYEFSDFSRVNRERLSLGLEYNRRPYFWAKANYLYSIYSDDLQNSHNFNEEISINIPDPLLLGFSHSREDVIDNSSTLRKELRKDDYKVRCDIRPNRRISFGGDYMYSNYTDGNSKDTYGLDVSSQLFYEPKSLKATYRYEEYRYDEPRDYYFTPSSFHFNKLSLEWRHFLNKEELFWGSNDTYYTLRYSVNFDVHSQRGHTIYADFHRDWNDKFSTHFQASKTMYEHRSTYKEDQFTAYMKYYF